MASKAVPTSDGLMGGYVGDGALEHQCVGGTAALDQHERAIHARRHRAICGGRETGTMPRPTATPWGRRSASAHQTAGIDHLDIDRSGIARELDDMRGAAGRIA